MEDHLSERSLLSHKHVSFDGQLKRIKKASEIAKEKVDYVMAHDEDILLAIEVVETFLRKKHRLCYGGQAINAHLPDQYKFYDPNLTIPDYDFFTPQAEQDIRALVQDLKRAGFQEISIREGMHEGTVKVYVEYVPVADITAIDYRLYRVLMKQEYRVNGISYMGANHLRMMMYLELSRPRGEVDRWPKVYERLMLLNTFASPPSCRKEPSLQHNLSKKQVEYALQWIIQKRRVFAGLALVQVYQQQLRSPRVKKVEWLIHTQKPILFYSSTPEEDAEALREGFEAMDQDTKKRYTIKTISKGGNGDLLPKMTLLQQGGKPLLFIIHQTACHSYFQLPMASRETLRIASLDTLITLYFSLSLIDLPYLDMKTMECLANEFVQLSIRMRKHPEKSPFPFISLNCGGHQSTLPSLIRSKVHRMTERKARLKAILDVTRSLSSKRKTVRNRQIPRVSSVSSD